ncbi:hypothetical protein HN51_054804, partial [Arachis hypogaea]
VINTPISHSGSIECVGFSPSDSWAAIGGLDKKLVIWDVEHSLSRSTCNHKFHTVLGGLGQFGVITRARISLHPAPTK